jgi:pyrophosphatase PpaX
MTYTSLLTRTQAILFDLDGTLIDTTSLILRCFDHSWQTVCGLKHSREVLIETFGTPLREAMINLAGRSGGNHDEIDLIDRLLGEYRSFNTANHDALARPFEGIQEVVSALRSRGYQIGVVTSKSRELGQRGLRLCSLDSLVDASIFLEDTDRHKPEPDPILAALERLNTPAHHAAYVGDSRHDIIAGRRAGVQTVAALWGPWPRAELESEKPDRVAESATDLLKLFD